MAVEFDQNANNAIDVGFLGGDEILEAMVTAYPDLTITFDSEPTDAQKKTLTSLGFKLRNILWTDTGNDILSLFDFTVTPSASSADISSLTLDMNSPSHSPTATSITLERQGSLNINTSFTITPSGSSITLSTGAILDMVNATLSPTVTSTELAIADVVASGGTEGLSSVYYLGGTGYYVLAQSFTPSFTGTVTRIDIDCRSRRDGAWSSGNGDLRLSLYSDSSGEPGTLLSSVTLDDFRTAGPDSFEYVTWDGFSQAVTASTKYWIVGFLVNQAADTAYAWQGSTTSTYSGGNMMYATAAVATEATLPAAWTSEATWDINFKVFIK